MEDKKKKKIIVISGIITIIILLLSLISCSAMSQDNTKSGYKIPGRDKVYDTLEEAEAALDEEFIVDGTDAILPDEVDTYVYGSKLFREDGSVLTYEEGYSYVNEAGEDDWEINKSTHDYDEGDMLNWNVHANFGHYVWSENNETITIPENVATGYNVDMSIVPSLASGVSNVSIAERVLDAVGLAYDTNVIISSPVIGDQSSNGYWVSFDGTTVNGMSGVGAGSHSDPEAVLENAAIHGDDAAIANTYKFNLDSGPGYSQWQSGGTVDTIAWNWGKIPGTSFTHIRLTNDPNSLPNYPERDEEVLEGWYKDSGYEATGTADGTYVKQAANYVDPAIIIADAAPLFKRGNSYNTGNIWTGTNVEGWYTDEYRDIDSIRPGPMDHYLVHPEVIYDHKSESDGYTDSVGLSTGTLGTWMVLDLDGNNISGAPDNFNTKADALKWLVDNDVIDYDVIEKV